jgi:hypothetical protein
MNYLGRARNADGSPKYEASYEINASLQISFPEFQQLVSHEVVPGHVTTFAYLQNLYARGQAGFEATVLTMNTRAATLFEGLANNAILIAHGVNEVEQLPDEDMQIGVLLALLQDDAKNQSSYLTWSENTPKEEVAKSLRRDFLVSEERADKLSGAWDGIPCWAGCICRRIAREPTRSLRCAARIPRSACSRQSTAALEWSTSTPSTRSCEPKRRDRVSSPPKIKRQATDGTGRLPFFLACYFSDFISITKRYFTSLFSRRS